MLKARLLTMSILIPVVVGAITYLPTSGLVALMGAVVGVAAWEWAELFTWSRTHTLQYVLLMLLAYLGVCVAVPPGWGLALAGLWWLFAAWQCYCYPRVVNAPDSHLYNALIGAWVLLPCGLAIGVLRQLGVEVVLAVLVLVWLADIAGYVFGKWLGKQRLMPVISPGKTWQGLAGQVLVALLAVPLLACWLPVFSVWVWGAVSLLVVVSALLGDMYESLIKRLVGVKDSGALLPGHGGILDRIDSMAAVLPLVSLLLINLVGPDSLVRL